MKKTNRSLLILILGLLSAIGPFSIDMYLPGFPVIADSLHTTVDRVAYSLSSFFIGVCVGQLICGPLLDRFGRKKPLITGLVLYIIASVGCSFAQTVDALILFRFVQALGCCVAMVAPSAIVRDVFPVAENARIFSLLILILGVSPILAPTVGSFVVAAWGWPLVFVVLAVVAGLILLLVVLRLPESKGADASVSLRPLSIFAGFARVVREPQFATYAFAGAIAAAGLFAYLAGSPFVFIFAIIAAGLIGCSQLNNMILKKYSSAQIIRVVLITQSATGLLLVGGTAMGALGLYGTIALMAIFLSCQGFTFPNSAALAMAPFTTGAGSASALMGALQMAFGAVASAMVGLFFDGTALPTTAIMSGCSLLGLVVLLMGSRRIKYKERMADLEAQRLEMIETI